VRCSLRGIFYHSFRKWIYKIVLTRYIVGRPNRITLPVEINFKLGKASEQYRDLKQYWNHKNVHFVCYNDLHPKVVMIDSDHIAKNPKFR